MPAYLFILVLLAIVWFFLIRPRQRQMRAQQQQMASLQVGDEIVTAGGLYEVRLEVAPDVVVRVAKRAVAAVLTENAPDELEAGEPAEEGDGTLPSA
jgi:preprotein translocase subunit YajC